MTMKICPSCGMQIAAESSFCPNCGARQNTQTNYESNYYSHPQRMSTNKILSIVALVISIISIFLGGLLAEIAAIIIASIVLNSQEQSEPEVITMSRIALIMSIVFIIIRIVLVIILGGIAALFYL